MADAGGVTMSQQSAVSAAAAKKVKKIPEPELMMWFAARGDTNLPPYVEIEARRAVAPVQGGRQR